MPTNLYECMFLLDTTKVQGDIGAADKIVRGLLEKNGCEVLVSRPWDERRLAYPIKNQKKGLYYLTYFRSEGKTIVGVEHDCALNEAVLRQLISKIDPKLEETMLAVARGEHAVALHNYQEEPSETTAEGEVPSTEEGGRPPRRRERARAEVE